MNSKHETILQSYIRGERYDMNELQNLWRLEETSLSTYDFEIAKLIRNHSPLPPNWSQNLCIGDNVTLIKPEPDYLLPVWFSGQQTTGIILNIDGSDGQMYQKRKPIWVKVKIEHMLIPLRESTKELLRRAGRLDEHSIEQSTYDYFQIYFHPNWLEKIP